MDIHPYVQGRLRALPRQDETSGILLGTTEHSVTHVTGFKRANPGAMRQAASEAGPALVGFYRLQTAGDPALQAEEEELLFDTHPDGRALFLLIKPSAGGVQATAWTREGHNSPVPERVPLDGSMPEKRIEEPMPETPLLSAREQSGILRHILIYSAIGLAAAGAFALLRPEAQAPALFLDLQPVEGVLTAVWEQQGTPKEKLQSATLSILDGAKEQTTDLTQNYTPRGRITVKPKSSDVVITLRIQYAKTPLVSRSATYVGYKAPAPAVPPPPPVQAAVVPPPVSSSEVAALRKRIRELEDANAALRKHMRQRR